MKPNESLKTKIWIYLIGFSFTIILFLWVFQILFLSKYYEVSKTKELTSAIREIKEEYGTDYFLNEVDEISKDKGICVQLVINNSLQYNSISFNKGCIADSEFDMYKKNFITSNLTNGTIKLVNKKFNNDVLIKAVKLDTNIYAFSSVSLQPLDSTITILKNQLIIVSAVVLLLALAIGYFISKKISVPIEKINNGVKELSKGNYKIKFRSDDNITEINELVDNLNNATCELDKTETLRAELLSNVSHDLKTPLTMIKAYAEMVRDITHNDKTKRTENLNVIIEETDRLNILVNDIIELSKIQTGFIELDKEELDLIKLSESIVNKFEYLNYDFKINSNKNTILIYADKKRIEQVIYNLVSNAVKYTGKDKKVIIDIIDENNLIKFSVSDTGKGIDPKDIKYIWDKYYKADKNYKRSSTGSGIGLSIVKNILIKHKYEYGVNSSKNKGTTFYFIIKKEKNN